jgi:FixJ family two-component response regulator
VTQAPTVFIVDDTPDFVESLSALIFAMGLKTQCFTSAEEYLATFDSELPGCLLLDVRMPGLDGLELQQQLRRMPLSPPVIVITGDADLSLALRAARQNAVEFLQKPFTEMELWDALHRAMTKDAANRLAHAEHMAKMTRLNQLTQGELDILHLILAGRSNKNMCTNLNLSRRTVEDRRARLMQKLAVDSIPELVRLAIELGISRRD